MKEIEVGIDYCGYGSFELALKRLGIPFKVIFACDNDKFARRTYIHNHLTERDQKLSVNELKKGVFVDPRIYSIYLPWNVYGRDIPEKSLDIYMTSPPCQAFSRAGLQMGKGDSRGILFFNSHEFIWKNRPRFFIFENVEGLLSNDKPDKSKKGFGRTFQEWLNLLGGKSINGVPVLFPDENAVPYHIYHTVLEATDYNVPQARRRVFIIGIRDDEDNSFTWPKPVPLVKKFGDILEENVHEKYFLKDKMIEGLRSFGAHKYINQRTQCSRVYNDTDDCFGTHGYANGYVQLSTRRTEKGREIRRKALSKGKDYSSYKEREFYIQGDGNIANTITTTPSKENLITNFERIRRLTPREFLRLQDVDDDFKIVVSDTQTYKQAGNSIPVAFLEHIIRNLRKL